METWTHDTRLRPTGLTAGGLSLGDTYYNGEGHRVKVTGAPGTMVFVYDAFGNLAAE